jgi:GNAT superfamily N-acetyltransferase
MEGARYSRDAKGTALYDGGVDDEYENYALPEPGFFARGGAEDVRRSIERGLDFFAKRNRPHIWPLFPGAQEEAGGVLSENGLARGDDFFAMTAPPDAAKRGRVPRANEIIAAKNAGEAAEWAALSWRGFGGGEPPAAFVSFAVNASKLGAINMIYIKGAAAGMLFASDSGAGIYYVSTAPEHRREGLGGTIVEALKSLALSLGFAETSLLATPAGRPLYLRHGFRDLETVQIYLYPPRTR